MSSVTCTVYYWQHQLPSQQLNKKIQYHKKWIKSRVQENIAFLNTLKPVSYKMDSALTAQPAHCNTRPPGAKCIILRKSSVHNKQHTCCLLLPDHNTYPEHTTQKMYSCAARGLMLWKPLVSCTLPKWHTLTQTKLFHQFKVHNISGMEWRYHRCNFLI